jgi:hypothetical protein
MDTADADQSSSGSGNAADCQCDIESGGSPESSGEQLVRPGIKKKSTEGSDFSLPNPIETNEEADEDSEDFLLVLPRRQSPQTDTVPNVCAICLDTYKQGDSVVWSCNKSCSHAFHQECLVNYLVKVDGTPCPMCRQNFLIEGEESQYSNS